MEAKFMVISNDRPTDKRVNIEQICLWNLMQKLDVGKHPRYLRLQHKYMYIFAQLDLEFTQKTFCGHLFDARKSQLN